MRHAEVRRYALHIHVNHVHIWSCAQGCSIVVVLLCMDRYMHVNAKVLPVTCTCGHREMLEGALLCM